MDEIGLETVMGIVNRNNRVRNILKDYPYEEICEYIEFMNDELDEMEDDIIFQDFCDFLVK